MHGEPILSSKSQKVRNFHARQEAWKCNSLKVWTGVFQDPGLTGLSDVSYSSRQSVSPVSAKQSDFSPELRPTYRDGSLLTEFAFICEFTAVFSWLLFFRPLSPPSPQVHVSSLGRESAGSPILIAENVTSATTHVTKVGRHMCT